MEQRKAKEHIARARKLSPILFTFCSMLSFLGLFACSVKHTDPEMSRVSRAFSDMAQTKHFRVFDTPYVQVKRITNDVSRVRLLERPVTMRVRAGLEEVLELVRTSSGCEVSLVRDGAAHGSSLQEGGKGGKEGHASSFDPEHTREEKRPTNEDEVDYALEKLFAGYAWNTSDLLTINYAGPLSGLLDQIAAQSGYGWDYEDEQKSIVFARFLTRTFQLKAPPGRVHAKTMLANKSKNDAEIGSAKGEKELLASQSADIAQSFEGDLGFDSFADTIQTIRAMLSKEGRCEGNAAAGTITVFDHPEQMRQIRRYIAEINANFSRQVVMKVNVYSLETKEELSAGFDLHLLVPRLSLGGTGLGIASESALLAGGLGTAQATILDGTLKGTSGMLKALQELGEARQITSAGIVALNNQPAPVEAISRTSYLARSSIETTEHGSETSLTPGEVTTGFSMTITPHILANRQVVLQYHVHLSTLDALESFESSRARIQLPKISSRAFSQKARMMMGQTLVLAGFQEAGKQSTAKTGLISLSREKNTKTSLIIVTIEVENAAPDLAEKA